MYLLFAFKMYAGRNWARIVLTVFGAFGAAQRVHPDDGRSPSTGETIRRELRGKSIIPWISGLLALAGIVLMYLPQSNEYFKRRRRTGSTPADPAADFLDHGDLPEVSPPVLTCT